MNRSPAAFVVCAFTLACRTSPPPPTVVAVAPAAAPTVAAAVLPPAVSAPLCRSALPFTPTPEATPVAPPPTDPVVVRACALAVATARGRLLPRMASLDAQTRGAVLDPVTRCYAAGAGAWAFAVEQVTAHPSEHVVGRDFTVDVRPIYLRPDGHSLRAAVTRRVAAGRSPFRHDVAHQDFGVFDWDGDGRGELYFREVHDQSEGHNDVARLDRGWTFTARGAEVREFVPEAARSTAIRDVDGDGRPDAVLRSPWVNVGPCGLPDADYPGPLGVLHSRPDGSFSPDDATAQAFIAHQCRERPTTLFAPIVDAEENDVPSNDPPHRVACARWWGRSAADVADEIART